MDKVKGFTVAFFYVDDNVGPTFVNSGYHYFSYLKFLFYIVCNMRLSFSINVVVIFKVLYLFEVFGCY